MKRFVMIDVEYEVPTEDESGVPPYTTEAEIAKSIMEDILASIREVLPVTNVDILNEGPAELADERDTPF